MMIELDISHTVVLLHDEDAELLRDRAAARAGRSAAARDLSLLLNQALTSGRRIALHRGELRALRPWGAQTRLGSGGEGGALRLRSG